MQYLPVLEECLAGGNSNAADVERIRVGLWEAARRHSLADGTRTCYRRVDADGLVMNWNKGLGRLSHVRPDTHGADEILQGGDAGAEEHSGGIGDSYDGAEDLLGEILV